MKKILILITSIVLAGVLFQACETDFDVNADWKDVTIVFGLLNQDESEHYVKVNKAFLGNSDVYDMAKVRDSSEYSNAEVYVYEMYTPEGESTDSVLTVHSLSEVTKTKDEGTFYSGDHSVFMFEAQLNYLNEYQVVIVIPDGDGEGVKKIVKSRTKLMEVNPEHQNTIWDLTEGSMQLLYSAVPDPLKGLNFDATEGQALAYTIVGNAKRYALSVRFHYDEVMADAASTVVPKYVDISLGNVIVKPQDKVGSTKYVNLTKEVFYGAIENSVPAITSDIERRIVKHIEYIAVIANDDLHTYLSANEPTNGVVQEKQQFTNIDGGFGIFASRYSSVFTSDIKSKYSSKLVLGDSEDPEFATYYDHTNKGFCTQNSLTSASYSDASCY